LFFLSNIAFSAPISLPKSATQIQQLFQDESEFNASNCADHLKRLDQQLAATNSTLKKAAWKESAPQILADLWQSRLKLRERMLQFLSREALQPECVKAARQFFRTSRFLEEYVGASAYVKDPLAKAQPVKVFSGGFPYLVTNGERRNVSLQSGDILISYGMAYASAAIAKVGEVEGQFSHMGIVYVDDKTHETFTVEAHPEFGVKVAPLAKYLNDGKGRSALFRLRNQPLARQAAKRIYDIALHADRSGHTIPYDFAMNLNDHSALFCTELIRYAFELAAHDLQQPFQVPLFTTTMTMKNPLVFDALGIKTRVTFAPGDIEVDPRFELIAEWRDLARARHMHYQQAILIKEFEWLDDLDYVFRSDVRTTMAAHALWVARHSPVLAGAFDWVPAPLSTNVLLIMANFYVVSDLIYAEIARKDAESYKKKGFLLNEQQLVAGIEQFRISDLGAYRSVKRWLEFDRANSDSMPDTAQFHWLFRPKNEK
jgi:hypothetical protein